MATKDCITFEAQEVAIADIKKICEREQLILKLEYQPCFDRKEITFSVQTKAPWSWVFVGTNKNNSQKKECLLLDFSGSKPNLTVKQDGKWMLAETKTFLLGILSWSLTDKNGVAITDISVLKNPFLQAETVKSSIYFPNGDTPLFLNAIFDLKLMVEGGPLQLLPSWKYTFEPQGKDKVVLPLTQYYNEKKAEKEKERGTAFSGPVIVGPTPETETIGTVIYQEIVDNLFESYHLTDETDVGFDVYLEKDDKDRILLYRARP